MAGTDKEAAAEVFERHAGKLPDLRDKLALSLVDRLERADQRRAERLAREEDDRKGTTQALIDGFDPSVDLDDPREHCITQERVDVIRARVTMETLLDAYRHNDFEVVNTLQYLWFPENDIRKIEVRTGNPPAEQDRPEHLRRIHLVMDHAHAPAELRLLVQEAAAGMRRVHKKQLKSGNRLRRTLQDNHALGIALRSKLGVKHG